MRSLLNVSKKGHERIKADEGQNKNMLDTTSHVLMVKNQIRTQRNAGRWSVSNHMHVSSWQPVGGPLRLHRFSFWKVASCGLDVLCVSRDTPVSVYTRFEKNLSYLSKLTRLYGNRFEIPFIVHS